MRRLPSPFDPPRVAVQLHAPLRSASGSSWPLTPNSKTKYAQSPSPDPHSAQLSPSAVTLTDCVSQCWVPVFSGCRKQDLVRWWLELVESNVNQFLSSMGYNHDAVPFDYIDHAPASRSDVEENLRIVRAAFGRDEDTNNASRSPDECAQLAAQAVGFTVRSLVTPLCQTIYAELDRFEAEALTALRETLLSGLAQLGPSSSLSSSSQSPPLPAGPNQLGTTNSLNSTASINVSSEKLVSPCDPALLHLLSTDDKFGWREAERAVRSVRMSLPDVLSKACLEVIRDLQYIEQMRHLERQMEENAARGFVQQETGQPKGGGGGGGVSDVVPIAGLVWGKLHRLENELRTVLEHWWPESLSSASTFSSQAGNLREAASQVFGEKGMKVGISAFKQLIHTMAPPPQSPMHNSISGIDT